MVHLIYFMFGSNVGFYRAIHYSAKSDHIGWNCSKIISRLVSMGRSLSADPNIMDLLQGEQPEIRAHSDPPPVDLSVGDIRSR